MSEKETLFAVDATDLATGRVVRSLIFRTRDAARLYKKSRKDLHRKAYKIRKATWGPEQ